MIKHFWKRAVVKDWKKNIHTVTSVMLLNIIVCTLICDDFGVIFVIVLSIIATFAGTIASFLLLPKRYLVVIPQLLLLAMVIFLNYYFDYFENVLTYYDNAHMLQIVPIVTNILSVIVVVYIRLIYELCSKLLRRVRGAEQKGNGHE